MEKSLAEEFNNFLADLRSSHRDSDFYTLIDMTSSYLADIKNMEYCVAALVLTFNEDLAEEYHLHARVNDLCIWRPIYKRALKFLVKESTDKLINL